MRPVSEHEILSAAKKAGWDADTATRLQVGEAETWAIDEHQIVVRVAHRMVWDTELSNLAVALAVYDCGIPTPEPLRTVTDGDRVFTYSRQVPEAEQPMDVRMEALGRALQQMHTSQVHTGRVWDIRRRKGAQIVKIGEAHGPGIESAVRMLWEEAVSNFVRVSEGQPLVFIHGDAHPGNLLCDSDGGAVLIDFEDAGWGTVDAEMGKPMSSIKRHVNMRSYEEAFWDGYGARVEVTNETIRMYEMSAVVWSGALSKVNDGAAAEFFHRLNTLDVHDADWNTF